MFVSSGDPSFVHRSKKRLGQHFLIDPNIARKIVTLANLQPDERVLEIGPGRGALTSLLCQAASSVMALELDPFLVDYLRTTLSDRANVEVRGEDALAFSYDQLATPVVVVANLPYNISTPLLFRLFDARAHITRMVLMIQYEVARRLTANAGTREYGILSVLTQYFTRPRWGFRVPPSCFSPRPEVISAVVRLDVRPETFEDPEATAWLVRTVRTAFQHRRKTLINTFRDAGFDDSVVRAAVAAAGIDGTRRAETLSLEEFLALSRALHQHAVGTR